MDRRQASVSWSAVFAGALTAGGIWLLLQLLLTGGALSAIDPEEVDNVRTFGMGASIGSMLAPLIAMFVGGLVAGRLASHRDNKVLGLHGALVWAMVAVFGLVITANAISQFASRPAATAHMAANAPAPGAGDYIDDQVEAVNKQLKAANAPTISKDDLVDASQYAVTPNGTLDRAALIARLDEKTQLSRPEAEAAVTAMGDRTPDVIGQANSIAQHRNEALEAAEDSGKAMLAAGVALLLCLAAAIGGSILGRRLMRRRGRHGGGSDEVTFRDRGDAVPTTPLAHTTAPYPATAPSQPVTQQAGYDRFGNGNRNPID